MSIAAYKHCPACERPRGDLGIGQACPDCGCPPTDDLTIIKQQTPAARALFIAGAVLFLLAVPGKDFGRWTPAALFALAIMVLIIAALIVRRRSQAVVWQEGFTLIAWDESPRSAAWTDFAGAKVDASRAQIVLVQPHGRDWKIPLSFFGTARRAAMFQAFAAQHIQTES